MNKDLKIQTPPFFEINGLSELSEREKRILSLTLLGTTPTQTEIMRKSGLAQQTVSRLVNGLISTGALMESARVSQKRRGQPSMAVGLVPEFAYSFGVAMMLDALSVVLMDFSGQVTT